jgi:hypothetical protein
MHSGEFFPFGFSELDWIRACSDLSGPRHGDHDHGIEPHSPPDDDGDTIIRGMD